MLINNTLFFVENHEVENPKATVIITHGIAEHSGRYLKIVEQLNQNGYRVVRYDLRGHGQTEGPRGKIKNYKQPIEDLHAIVMSVKNKFDLPVYLLGHSMGGLIVDMYGVTYHDVDGIIASAAASYYVKDVAPFKLIGYKWLSFVKLKTNFADHKLSTIREVEQRYIEDPLNLKYYYVSLAGGMMLGGVRYLNKNIEHFNTPILILHGGKDEIVPPAFSKRFFDLIQVEDKEIKFYNQSLHEILNDVEQEEVRNDIVAWLDKRVKA
ncbi:MAG: lysophospholipase [Acholeplasmataceae bacterium]